MKIKFLLISLVVLALTGGTALAGTIDLTTGGSGSATAAIGGQFLGVWMDQQSTGTGVIDPFSRLQNNGAEQGYNTDLAPQTPLDEKAGTWTHALDVTTIPIVTINGVQYREFILDINESVGGDQEFLSLNQVQIFKGPDPLGSNTVNPAASATTDPVISFSAAQTEIFRMNNANAPDATRNTIQLDFTLNPGSGAGDMQLYVLNSLFPATGNITLYSQFGDPRGFASDGESSDGFEEWAVRVSTGTEGPPVPEPATLLLTGTGLVALALGLRRKLH